VQENAENQSEDPKGKPLERKAGADSPNGSTVGAAPYGARVRRLRQLEGKSLRALAQELGISPSALSMLENERSGVSLRRLQLIADHFGLQVVELISDNAPKQMDDHGVEVIRQMAATIPSIERGKGVTYQVPTISSSHVLQPALVSFAPGSGYLNDAIGHVGEEVVLVLVGQIELHRGDEKVVLNQGDLALFASGVPHAYQNASTRGPALIMTVATPPW
jgi:transcriptional regulator with XRE-family HTH domain